MTAPAIRADFSGFDRGSQSIAVSTHASRLSKALGQATVHGRAHAADWRTLTCALVEQLAADHALPNWDGHGARPISVESKQYAQAFVNLLPFSYPAPDPVADPDGEVALSWDFGPGHVLTLSIDRTGMICYAGLVGGRAKRHGVEPFDGRVPEVIREALTSLRDRAGAR